MYLRTRAHAVRPASVMSVRSLTHSSPHVFRALAALIPRASCKAGLALSRPAPAACRRKLCHYNRCCYSPTRKCTRLRHPGPRHPWLPFWGGSRPERAYRTAAIAALFGNLQGNLAARAFAGSTARVTLERHNHQWRSDISVLQALGSPWGHRGRGSTMSVQHFSMLALCVCTSWPMAL